MAKVSKIANQKDEYLFFCPGCKCAHRFFAGGPKVPHRPQWEFDGNMENPTISPSISVKGTVPITEDEHRRLMGGEKIKPKKFVCHSYVKDGMIQFLSDCTHELKNQTVALPDIDKVDK